MGLGIIYRIKTFDSQKITFWVSPNHYKLGSCKETAFYILDIEREIANKHSEQFLLCRDCIHGVLTYINEIVVIQTNYPNYLESCQCGKIKSCKKAEGYLPKEPSAWIWLVHHQNVVNWNKIS